VKNPQWYVTAKGQTMVVIPGAAEFDMGSPATEAEGEKDKYLRQHRKRIERTFAIAATPVTREQFLRYRPQFPPDQLHWYPEPACPIGSVLWHDAAAYCNWLSEKEGIPPEEWCYKFEKTGNAISIKLKQDYLSLRGYRLPTEAEWEYACRAGALTARYYGESEELLRNYGWYFQTSDDHSWPVGSLKPNDLGLFDMHGNMWNWCQERYQPYPETKLDEPTVDKEDHFPIGRETLLVLRGGAFSDRASSLRSAMRGRDLPARGNFSAGFRLARTIVP
jgi:formylglycine-generating enzyme required for sulfatase activity